MIHCIEFESLSFLFDWLWNSWTFGLDFIIFLRMMKFSFLSRFWSLCDWLDWIQSEEKKFFRLFCETEKHFVVCWSHCVILFLDHSEKTRKNLEMINCHSQTEVEKISIFKIETLWNIWAFVVDNEKSEIEKLKIEIDSKETEWWQVNLFFVLHSFQIDNGDIYVVDIRFVSFFLAEIKTKTWKILIGFLSRSIYLSSHPTPASKQSSTK